MTAERIDGPPTATLDDAQAALIEALTAFEDNARLTQTGHEVVDVADGGADRFERVVTFTLALADGTTKTFAATIKEEEEAWEPE